MKKLTAFFKQFRLSQLLTAILATFVLFVSTACNSGDVQGARPNNPPVQAGGQNNPYKMGGDTNTNYKMSPDPKVSNESGKYNRGRADLQLLSEQLIATSETRQYPQTSEIKGSPTDEQKPLPYKNLKDYDTYEAGGQIQRQSDLGERIKDRLGAVKETFDEAGEFINENAEEAKARHEIYTKPHFDN
jgi:hypothetical protein